MLKQFIYVILFILLCPLSQANADISLKELIYKDQQPFHLKLLKALPEEAKIGFGPKNADNVIIEKSALLAKPTASEVMFASIRDSSH